MKLTRNAVRILVVLMIVALAGLAFLQARLFTNNVELKREAFRQNVLSALNAAATKLEEIDLRDRFFAIQTEGPIQFRRPSDTPFYSKVIVTSGRPKPDTAARRTFSFTSFDKSISTNIEGNVLKYDLNRSQKVRVALFDVLGRLDTVLLDMRIPEGAHTVRLPEQRGIRILKIETDSAAVVHRWEGESATGYVVGTDKDSLENVVLRVAETFKSGLPVLARRLRPGLVDSVLKEQFVRSGIDLPITYAVYALPQDSLLFGDANLSRGQGSSGNYTTMLFAGDFSGNAGELVVRFPTYGSYLFSEFLPELTLNVLFLAVVIGSFWFTVRILVRQREFAGRLSDFINNMTHEFKTPLSTIALASEALHRPDVLKSKAKIRRYNKIITEEYARMRGQVDKILDMAALEEGDAEFHRAPIDLHELILKTADHISLEISSRGGALAIDLNATAKTIVGDAIHLENVLHNVLDNAVKYSPAAPEIRISTENIHGTVVVHIRDNGIGIPREHQHKVFEKYFRVPTGNVHDVKGFGLGLSYVKLVTEAHGGKAMLESEPGKGTTVTLRFPTTTS